MEDILRLEVVYKFWWLT